MGTNWIKGTIRHHVQRAREARRNARHFARINHIHLAQDWRDYAASEMATARKLKRFN